VATDTQREKRRVILRAAITVFAHHGYHTSRVADVAREAGVAYGLVYHYFGSKEELLETIFRRTWSRMLELVQEVERSATGESCSAPPAGDRQLEAGRDAVRPVRLRERDVRGPEGLALGGRVPRPRTRPRAGHERATEGHEEGRRLGLPVGSGLASW
jgi:TetR/AcrR family transcriptional regulator, fatty acid metabolism regulator protein